MFHVASRRVAAKARRICASARRRYQSALGAGLVLLSGAASATTTSPYPATLEDAQAFLEGKGTLALGLTVLGTVIILGMKFSKMPRRA